MKKQKSLEYLFSEIISAEFPNLEKDINIKYKKHLQPQIGVLEKILTMTQYTQTLKNKIKERISNFSALQCQVIFKVNLIRLTAEFSKETIQGKIVWRDIV